MGMERMLIIDDEESICFAMSEYFKVQGYLVDSAQSVQEAEVLLHTGPYSMVISDLRLAGSGKLGGIEVIKSVRQKYPRTPIIVLSAYRSPEIEAELAENGVGAFLRKPMPLPDIAQIAYGLAAIAWLSLAAVSNAG
jgi:DNA-binding NtrC family response regulator